MKEAKISPLVETFGDTPLVKVLDFFLTYPAFDYTKSFVAKEAGISRITIGKIWEQLAKSGLIRKTRTIGNAEYFQLAREHPRVKVLMKTAIELSFSRIRPVEKAVPA